jgi:hypothetical protein
MCVFKCTTGQAIPRARNRWNMTQIGAWYLVAWNPEVLSGWSRMAQHSRDCLQKTIRSVWPSTASEDRVEGKRATICRPVPKTSEAAQTARNRSTPDSCTEISEGRALWQKLFTLSPEPTHQAARSPHSNILSVTAGRAPSKQGVDIV